jgi:aryl-alcohol dehydrogenase-like predicted oxidoreductase
MNYKTLGKSSLSVSPLTFGGNVFGWTLNETESFRILDQFVDAGFNSIDTADTYSKWVEGNQGGESETIIGNWLKNNGKRDQVIIGTKLGGELGPDKKGLSAAYIVKAVEASLTRLQTDYIDLYQAHYDDLNTPQEETLEAFDKLIKEGKVRYIGASNLSGERLKSSLEISKKNNLAEYISLQPLYNLYDRSKFETEYLPLIKEYSIGVLPYYSLASGFLSGKYRSESDLNKSLRGHGIKKYLNERGFKILNALDKIAETHGASPARVALAWLLHKPEITSPIVSATNDKQMNELILSAQLSLSPEEMQFLDQESAF